MMSLPSAYEAPPRSFEHATQFAARFAALCALISSGAIFGFFYAWICSTMWGLDAADPRVAIEAMQAMNASVRNAVFAPAFFGTPVFMAIAAIFAWRVNTGSAALAFGLGGLIYAVGGIVLTMSINVPMNEALASIVVPTDVTAAQDIWTAYSGDWQLYNIIRTVFSGITLALAGVGLMKL